MMISRSLALILPAVLFATTIDRISAVIDRQVITLSEVNQMVAIRFFPRAISRTDDEYRHEVLEALIAQALRYRDVERFGAQDIPKDSIESRLTEIGARFGSPRGFPPPVTSG